MPLADLIPGFIRTLFPYVFGLSAGFILATLLMVLRRIIAGHGSVFCKEFAACVFWILNGGAWMALYIVYLRRTDLPLIDVAGAATIGLLLQVYCARVHTLSSDIRPQWLSCNVLGRLAFGCWAASL
ncbi:hypothetical protein, partial [Pseudomonas congelans]|uniref:hypothetical protein n=2 Tax=Pseudomonas TaxID=286 RepID=UPI001F40CC31